MGTQRSTVAILAAFFALLVLSSPPAHAGQRKLKQMRLEIDRLQARIAQLQSETQFLMRREMVARPAQVPIGGVCADPCSFDADGDGTNDCEDTCPCDAENVDGDADGAPDCVDPCPGDATDGCLDPCRMDSDGDGAHDCTDRCPWGEGQGKPCSDPPAPPPDGDGCQVGGCSGQICADHSVITTCEWRDAYACYWSATCERQADGACGWTQTDELAACLDAAGRH
jgi:hypothetical protein